MGARRGERGEGGEGSKGLVAAPPRPAPPPSAGSPRSPSCASALRRSLRFCSTPPRREGLILALLAPPSAVQPHLRKCFEAIETLDFAPNLEISAMNSKEKEKVPFDKTMFPTGNVEVWLGERGGGSVMWICDGR